MGGMAIFGSYIEKNHSLMGESARIIALDTLVAVIAGVIMFPACFTYGLEVNAGPSLLFDTMASVFNNMDGGRWWGSLFFLFMVFAAVSTVLGVCENILAMIRELTGLAIACFISSASPKARHGWTSGISSYPRMCFRWAHWYWPCSAAIALAGAGISSWRKRTQARD